MGGDIEVQAAEVQAALSKYVMTEDEKGMLDDITTQLNSLMAERQTILRVISRRRNLVGNWSLAADNSELTINK